jgi:MFS family permease
MQAGGVALLAGLAVIASGQTVLFAVLPPAARGMGLAPWQAGLLISLSGLAFAASMPFWGGWSDRRGRRPPILLGFVAYAALTALFALLLRAGMAGAFAGVPALLVLLPVRLLFGIGVAAAMPAAQAWVADTTPPDRRAAALARVSMAFGLGTILGPALAATLAGFGLHVPLLAAAALAAMLGLLLWRSLLEPARSVRPPPRPLIGDRRVRAAALTALGFFSAVGALLQALGFLAQDRLALAPEAATRTVGICLAAAGLSALAVQAVLARRRGDRPLALIRLGLLVSAIGFALVALAPSLPLMVLGVALAGGAGMGLIQPGLAAAASLAVTEAEQGAAAGTVGGAQAGGFVLGPVIGGLLYDATPAAPFAAGAVLLLALLALQRTR